MEVRHVSPAQAPPHLRLLELDVYEDWLASVITFFELDGSIYDQCCIELESLRCRHVNLLPPARSGFFLCFLER